MPRTADHAERHRAIVFAVWALIARGSIESVTLRGVAAEAGMSLGQLQHYVATKADLVRRACAAMIDLAEAAYVGQELDDDPWAAIRAVLVSPFARSDTSRVGVRVWHAFLAKSVDDPEIARLINTAKSGTEEELARLLDAGGADPTLARGLLALSDGLSARTLTDGLSPAAAETEVDRVLDRARATGRPDAAPPPR